MPTRIDEPAIPYQNPGSRLLYVGSDQHWLADLRKVLRKPEFHIVSCPDRGSAILFLRGDPRYHLLLFEHEPRGTPGLELTRLARSLPHREHLPIIIVAGEEVTDQLAKRARRAGANECLSKTGDISVAAASVLLHLRTSPSLRFRCSASHFVRASGPARHLLYASGASSLRSAHDNDVDGPQGFEDDDALHQGRPTPKGSAP